MVEPPATDVCLIVEGSYPYVSGGVSSWVQQLIESQSHLTFQVVSIVAPSQDLKLSYELPKNVTQLIPISLQSLPSDLGYMTFSTRKDFYKQLRNRLKAFFVKGGIGSIQGFMDLHQNYPKCFSEEILLNSEEAWEIILGFYKKYMSASSFIDFFWAWRNLFSSLFSTIVADVPKARLYHAVCTGYAGLLLAKAKILYKNPCLLTEHGIYTNERQIEITLADWIEYQKNFSLQLRKTKIDYDLKDFWMSMFEEYSRICYDSCDEIITLYEGNKELQRSNGADPKKLRVIPNGIDYDQFSQIERDPNHPPTIALIGRVVPIKDVQTYIQACIMVQKEIPELRAYIMGPYEEDPDYYEECLETVKYAKMEDCIKFTGKVNIKEYLAKIDVSVLTSLSEAQPLVILEAGAAGVPSVATDVGSCKELLYGKVEEVGSSAVVKGGEIVQVGSPEQVAEALIRLLKDRKILEQYQDTLKSRVYHYYNKTKIDQIYRELYEGYLKGSEDQKAA